VEKHSATTNTTAVERHWHHGPWPSSPCPVYFRPGGSASYPEPQQRASVATPKPANGELNQDIDPDGGLPSVNVSNCLERRKETASNSPGRLGWSLRRIQDATRIRRENGQPVPERGRGRGAAAGQLGRNPARRQKPAIAGGHRPRCRKTEAMSAVICQVCDNTAGFARSIPTSLGAGGHSLHVRRAERIEFLQSMAHCPVFRSAHRTKCVAFLMGASHLAP